MQALSDFNEDDSYGTTPINYHEDAQGDQVFNTAEFWYDLTISPVIPETISIHQIIINSADYKFSASLRKLQTTSRLIFYQIKINGVAPTLQPLPGETYTFPL